MNGAGAQASMSPLCLYCTPPSLTWPPWTPLCAWTSDWCGSCCGWTLVVGWPWTVLLPFSHLVCPSAIFWPHSFPDPCWVLAWAEHLHPRQETLSWPCPCLVASRWSTWSRRTASVPFSLSRPAPLSVPFILLCVHTSSPLDLIAVIQRPFMEMCRLFGHWCSCVLGGVAVGHAVVSKADWAKCAGLALGAPSLTVVSLKPWLPHALLGPFTGRSYVSWSIDFQRFSLMSGVVVVIPMWASKVATPSPLIPTLMVLPCTLRMPSVMPCVFCQLKRSWSLLSRVMSLSCQTRSCWHQGGRLWGIGFASKVAISASLRCLQLFRIWSRFPGSMFLSVFVTLLTLQVPCPKVDLLPVPCSPSCGRLVPFVSAVTCTRTLDGFTLRHAWMCRWPDQRTTSASSSGDIISVCWCAFGFAPQYFLTGSSQVCRKLGASCLTCGFPATSPLSSARWWIAQGARCLGWLQCCLAFSLPWRRCTLFCWVCNGSDLDFQTWRVHFRFLQFWWLWTRSPALDPLSDCLESVDLSLCGFMCLLLPPSTCPRSFFPHWSPFPHEVCWSALNSSFLLCAVVAMVCCSGVADGMPLEPITKADRDRQFWGLEMCCMQLALWKTKRGRNERFTLIVSKLGCGLNTRFPSSAG